MNAPRLLSLPTAHIYARRSHHTENDSIPDQIARGRSLAKDKIEACGVREWKEEGTSAYKLDFALRPVAVQMLAAAKPNDHVIVDKLDRLARSTQDFLNTIAMLESRGLILHIRNFQGMEIDMSSPMGKFMVTILAAFAELESGIKSERILDAFEQKRQRGEQYQKTPPIGMKAQTMVVEGKKRKYLVWDPIALNTLKDIQRLREQCGFTFQQIRDILNQDWCTRKGIPFERLGTHGSKTPGIGRPWSKLRVEKHYYRYKFYLDLRSEGITEPRDVAIEIHKRLARKDKKRSQTQRIKSRTLYKSLQENTLDPAIDIEAALPDWAKGNEIVDKVLSASERGRERKRHLVYDSINTLDKYLAQQSNLETDDQ